MLAALLAAPALAKVLGSLLLVVVLQALTKRLGAAALVGAVVLGIWCGHPLLSEPGQTGLLAILGRNLVAADSLLLVAVILQVIWLSSQMSATGVMDGLVTAVRDRVSRRGACGG